MAMNLFQHSYYRLNKIMMTFIGQWPDQSTRTRRACCGLLIYFYASEIMLRIRTISNSLEDVEIIVGWMILTVIQVLGVTFFVGFMLNAQKVSQFFSTITIPYIVPRRLVIEATNDHRSVRYIQTLKLLNRICTDWQVWAREPEVTILHQYTELGKKINIVFAG